MSGLRERLQPGDEILDQAGHNIITYDGAGIGSVAYSCYGDFLRALHGELDLKEYAAGAVHRQAIRDAYTSGGELPEGAAIRSAQAE